MQETQVQSLSQEDPLKERTTHSSILAWESLVGYSLWSCKTVRHDLMAERKYAFTES